MSWTLFGQIMLLMLWAALLVMAVRNSRPKP